MTRWTFLDYLTRRTPQAITARFDFVFSDLTKDQKKQIINDIINITNENTGVVPDAKLPAWLTKLGNLKSNRAKEIEKILDMSPEEIENLFKVIKSPSNSDLLKELDQDSQNLLRKKGIAKDKMLDITDKLSPRMLNPTKSPDEIKNTIQGFKQRHKNTTVEYDTRKWLLVVS